MRLELKWLEKEILFEEEEKKRFMSRADAIKFFLLALTGATRLQTLRDCIFKKNQESIQKT